MTQKMNVEQALQIVGSFGRFQAFTFVCIAFIQLFLGWQMLQMEIIGANFTSGTNEMETIITEWDLYDKTWVVNLIDSIFMFGVMVGNITVGQLADKYGRRFILFQVFALLILTSFLTSFANNYQILAVIRFFVGICQGGTVLVSFVLAQELLGSSIWTLTGNLMPAFFALGIASLAGIGSVCTNWRDLCWATSLPALIIWSSVFVIPESPRWLFSQGRVREAEEILRYIAMKNGVSMKACSTIVLKAPANEKGSATNTVMDLFSSKIMIVRTLVMGYLWFVCSFTYYGLTMGAGSLSSNLYTSLALSGLVELPSYLICGLLINRKSFGRRKTLAGMLMFCGIACLAIMFVHVGSDGTSKAKMALALSGKLAVSAAFSIVYIYASELFPTVLRNVGMGTSSMCARIGGILAPFVGYLHVIASPLPFIVFGTVAVLGGVLALLLPETLNQPIPATIEDIVEGHKSKLRTEEDKQQLLSN